MLLLVLAACGDMATLTDEDNHVVERDLSIPVLSIHDEADVWFDWTQVTTDLRCRDIELGDMHLSLVSFPELTASELEVALEVDGLRQSDLNDYIEASPVGCEPVILSEMDFNGADIVLEGLGTDNLYLLALTKNSEGSEGPGALVSAVILEGDPDADTVAVMPDGCGLLSLDVTIPEAGVSLRRASGIF